jgi:hypothetical protein
VFYVGQKVRLVAIFFGEIFIQSFYNIGLRHLLIQSLIRESCKKTFWAFFSKRRKIYSVLCKEFDQYCIIDGEQYEWTYVD